MIKERKLVYQLGFLADKQESLDKLINNIQSEKMKDLTEQEVFENKLVALLVEVGEFANEHRGFKYWSCDQSVRTELLYEEFADTLHLMLSLGNSLGHKVFNVIAKPTTLNFQQLLIKWFNNITVFASDSSITNYEKMLQTFVQIAEVIGLDDADIRFIYDNKHVINIQRQKEGY